METTKEPCIAGVSWNWNQWSGFLDEWLWDWKDSQAERQMNWKINKDRSGVGNMRQKWALLKKRGDFYASVVLRLSELKPFTTLNNGKVYINIAASMWYGVSGILSRGSCLTLVASVVWIGMISKVFLPDIYWVKWYKQPSSAVVQWSATTRRC